MADLASSSTTLRCLWHQAGLALALRRSFGMFDPLEPGCAGLAAGLYGG